MGNNCRSTPSETSNDPAMISRNLDDKLKAEHSQERSKIKLLLLGTGESGKSTIFKQMKVIYGSQFTVLERKQQLPTIYANIIEGIKMLVKQAGLMNLKDRVLAVDSFDVISRANLYENMTIELGNHITSLWRDPGIQMVWCRRHEFQINESVKYFFEKVDIMKMPHYVPDIDDMLYCRFRTSGIVTEKYVINGTVFEMYDVGGQRNERKKWIHCFAHVTGVLFVAGLSDFNQSVFEDVSLNRMVEAINLFEYICNNSYFVNSSIILFLNKRDLFQEKIQKYNISDTFEDYTGEPGDYDAGVNFFVAKFLSRHISGGCHNIYHHVTCATDTRNIHVVFNACKDIVLRQNLSASGLLE